MKTQFITSSTSRQVLCMLLLVGLSLTSCQNQPKSAVEEATAAKVQESQKETPNVAIGDTTEKLLSEDEVVDLVLALPITQRANKQINEATKGQKGVSVMVEPEETIEHGQKYYVVRIGYNGNDRYETYHLLYVNKQDRGDIRIEDPIEGTIISLAQWEEEN